MPAPEIHNITSAPSPLADDMHPRMVKYTISMTVRTVCFLLAIFCPGYWRWVFAGAAMVLPYIAVVIANAGRERIRHGNVGTVDGNYQQITDATASNTPGTEGAPIIEGSVVDSSDAQKRDGADS